MASMSKGSIGAAIAGVSITAIAIGAIFGSGGNTQEVTTVNDASTNSSVSTTVDNATSNSSQEYSVETVENVTVNTYVETKTSNSDETFVPAFSGAIYYAISDAPSFDSSDFTTIAFEKYSALDSLGRCGVAYACLGQETMPADGEERGSISSIYPSGWVQAKYSGIDGGYLYNRCHLIGWQLSAENANKCNLITGTRYFNVSGMLPFENMVADYINETGNHVLYRVTPDFRGNNLVCNGVQMEAWSVEDNGEGICFNVYVYNIQPGITIDYATGKSSGTTSTTAAPATTTTTTSSNNSVTNSQTYVLNTNTKKFHYPGCYSVDQMSEKNKAYSSLSRDELISQGYSPCKNCNP